MGPNLTDDASLLDGREVSTYATRPQNIRNAGARGILLRGHTIMFHLTVSGDNAVVVWLNAQGHNAAERLRAIGERVGLGPHTKAYDFFEMADSLSDIVSRIENGDFNNQERCTVVR